MRAGKTAKAIVAAALCAVAVAAWVILSVRPDGPGRGVPAKTVMSVTARTCGKGTTYDTTFSGGGRWVSVSGGDVVSRVGGRVVATDPGLVPGGRFRKGDTLFVIDDTDLLSAVVQARSSLLKARETLDKAVAAAKSSEASLAAAGIDDPTPLALGSAAVKTAKTAFGAAKALLRSAERDLEDRVVKAPADMIVSEVTVFEGDVIQAGSVPVTGVFDGDVVLAIPVPAEIAGRISSGTEAVVAGGAGVVTGVSPKADEATGTVTVFVATAGNPGPVGGFGEAIILTGTEGGACVLPGSAVRGGGRIWLVDKGRLRAAIPDIVASGNGEVVIRADDAEGLPVVTSPMAAPVEGQLVEVVK